MKKAVSFLLATALICTLLCIPTLALSAPDEDGVWLDATAADFTITPCTADGTVIAADTTYDFSGDGNADAFYAGAARFTVTYSPASGLVVGDNYTIIMYTGGSISPDSILYIDQISVSEEDIGNGSLTFDVFPQDLDDAVIKVTSDADVGPVTVTTVHLSYTLGDVNRDGSITTVDAVLILQYYVRNIDLTAQQKKAADTNKNNEITTLDAVLILQYYVHIIDDFNSE